MKYPKYLFFLLICLISVSCFEGEKKLELDKREAELREKEKLFAVKEAEYQSLLKMRDSVILQRDSIAVMPVLPVNIVGKWTGKIVCTESNCQDYVVGDTRVDEWQITDENGQITAKNQNMTGTVRIYTGKYDGNSIKLHHPPDAASARQLDLKIDFTSIDSTRLSGTRDVQVNQSCNAKFSIELTR